MTNSACQHHASSLFNDPKQLHIHPLKILPQHNVAEDTWPHVPCSGQLSLNPSNLTLDGSLKPFFKTSKHA
ncbi:unnamed protein product [Fusarium graminearum]|uniref:Uncharacterized protein n=1 Tax=Gibberella zeae TaxID=5518 RepID=A0A4U9FHY9_GIBZA|nr:unnamed protein product [Fusarium graminearum]CAF3549197.1 unnamed protein product [Fusarium graminearum]CAF3586184.1 unnamed protein product [Fusarium graminearum]CAG1977060.1 unnamed protein product [Fusarium graminearum]CAG1978561.1 unnamed protein product [Fusarium graminearum]